MSEEWKRGLIHNDEDWVTAEEAETRLEAAEKALEALKYLSDRKNWTGSKLLATDGSTVPSVSHFAEAALSKLEAAEKALEVAQENCQATTEAGFKVIEELERTKAKLTEAEKWILIIEADRKKEQTPCHQCSTLPHWHKCPYGKYVEALAAHSAKEGA